MSISHFTDVSGCICLIDSTTGLYSDLGTTLTTTNGTLIEQINDQSGAGNHWTQTTSGNRASVATDAELAVKVINFNGSHPDFYNLPNFLSGLSGATGASHFTVFKMNNFPPAGNQTTGFHTLSSGGALAAHLTFTDNIMYDTFGSSTARISLSLGSNSRGAAKPWLLVHQLAKTNDMRLGTDGLQRGAVTASSTFGFSSTPIWGKNSNGWGFDGQIRLIVMYDHLVTDSEFDDIVQLIQTSTLAAVGPRLINGSNDKLQYTTPTGATCEWASLINGSNDKLQYTLPTGATCEWAKRIDKIGIGQVGYPVIE